MYLNRLERQNKARINTHVLELFKEIYMYGDAINSLAGAELIEVETVCKTILEKVINEKEKILEGDDQYEV